MMVMVTVRALGVHLPSRAEATTQVNPLVFTTTAIVHPTGQAHATAAEHYGRDDGHDVLPPSPIRQNPRIVLVVPWKHPAAARGAVAAAPLRRSRMRAVAHTVTAIRKTISDAGAIERV